MANGQQVAADNVLKFSAWAASKTDAEFRALAKRGVLSRTEIAAECGFAKSALSQNPRIREALKALEDGLRAKAVLPALADEPGGGPPESRMRTPDPARNAREAERLSRLEQENASLRAENTELKRQLRRFTVLQDALSETGRIPR